MKRTQLITTADLTREEVDYLIKESENMRGKRTDDLKGKICATLFFEPSTRTRLSFESAIHRLGGSIINVTDVKTTSEKKGETLEDSIKVIEKYADIMIMRHPEVKSSEKALKVTEKPFINGGDGSNQHPTQALLDIYTVSREMGKIDGLTIGFVGDLKYGRTVHSLIYILALYDIKKVIFISPDTLKIPTEYLDILKEKNIEYAEDTDLKKNMPKMDVLYMTRIQQERFEYSKDYEDVKGSYIITADIVKMGKPELRILHPLPRLDEIATEVDDMEQSACFRQVENGIYMRMALLKTLTENYYN